MRSRYFPHIDTLRAWAVLAVLTYHVRPGLVRSGFLGVDLFFVISGFVVSASVANFDGNFQSFMATFYARRFKRIVPALLVTVLVGVLLSILFIPYMSMSAAIERVASKALLGMANLELSKIAMDYFSPTAELNTLTHTWSLGVEEQFYILFPFLFFGWLRGGRTRAGAVAGLALLTAGSFAYSLHLGPTAAGFYSSFGRGWEIGAGVLLYQAWTASPQSRPSALKTTAVYLALVALAVVLLAPPWAWVSRVGVVGLGALLLVSVDENQNKLFANPLFLRIGKWSYSLYLIHWPLVVLMRWTWGLDTLAKQVAILMLSFMFAALSYAWLETPFRELSFWRASWGPKTNLKIIAAGILSLFIASKAIKVLYLLRPELSLTASSRAAEDWFPDKVKVGSKECPLSHVQLGENAWLWQRASSCSLAPVIRPALFMLGDSHANAYDALVRKLSHDEGYKVYSLTEPGCALVSLNEDSAGCRDFFKSSQELILKNAHAGDFLFLPGLRVDRLSDNSSIPSESYVDMLTEVRKAIRATAVNEAPATLEPYLRAGLKIILEAPKPVYRYAGFRCADVFNRTNPVCRFGPHMDRSALLNYEAPIFDALKTVAAEAPPGRVVIWDPFQDLCPPTNENQCLYYQNGRPLFSDGDHLSGYGNLILFDPFRKLLKAL